MHLHPLAPGGSPILEFLVLVGPELPPAAILRCLGPLRVPFGLLSPPPCLEVLLELDEPWVGEALFVLVFMDLLLEPQLSVHLKGPDRLELP